MIYHSDILKNGFEQTTLQQPDDYEGKVTCTIVRKKCPLKSNKAVLYVHGFNDYFFQEEMAERYVANGFHFYAIDLRKYGRSFMPHQKLNNVRDLTEYFADLDKALSLMEEEGMNKVLLSGHSTGGLVISLYADVRKSSGLFDALFLNSPFFDMPVNAIVKNLLFPLSVRKGLKNPNHPLPGGFSPMYGESLHTNDKGEWSYNLDWKPHVPPPFNCGWLRAIRLGQYKIASGLSIIQPMLVMHSERSITPSKWSEQVYESDVVLNYKDIIKGTQRIEGRCTRLAISGGMHDLVLSRIPVRNKVYSHLFNWLASTSME